MEVAFSEVPRLTALEGFSALVDALFTVNWEPVISGRGPKTAGSGGFGGCGGSRVRWVRWVHWVKWVRLGWGNHDATVAAQGAIQGAVLVAVPGSNGACVAMGAGGCCMLQASLSELKSEITRNSPPRLTSPVNSRIGCLAGCAAKATGLRLLKTDFSCGIDAGVRVRAAVSSSSS